MAADAGVLVDGGGAVGAAAAAEFDGAFAEVALELFQARDRHVQRPSWRVCQPRQRDSEMLMKRSSEAEPNRKPISGRSPAGVEAVMRSGRGADTPPGPAEPLGDSTC